MGRPFAFHFLPLPGTLYNDRKTNEINLCLVLWVLSKLLFLQCLLIALKPLLCSCTEPFWQVLGYMNGFLQHILLFLLYCRECYLCGHYRGDAVSPSHACWPAF